MMASHLLVGYAGLIFISLYFLIRYGDRTRRRVVDPSRTRQKLTAH